VLLIGLTGCVVLDNQSQDNKTGIEVNEVANGKKLDLSG